MQVRRRLDMELAPDTPSALAAKPTSDGFKTPKAKRARAKSAAVTVPTLSFSPSPQRSMYQCQNVENSCV